MRAKYAAALLIAGMLFSTGASNASAHQFSQGPVGAHDPAFVNCTDYITISFNARPAPGYSSQYVAAQTYSYWWNGSNWVGRGWSSWNIARVEPPPTEIISWGSYDIDEPDGFHYFYTVYAWYNPNVGWDGLDGNWTTSGWYGGNRSDYCYQQPF